MGKGIDLRYFTAILMLEPVIVDDWIRHARVIST